MHEVKIPQSVIDRVVARRGREHCFADFDSTKTALVVVDMQNAFMLDGVGHAVCDMALEIVPNINRLARAVRQFLRVNVGAGAKNALKSGTLC